ncbi:alpha/beta fold hydrolase [Micromonospora sp. NBC_01796]|uniref:alpha/beta fold hydrolase n=1 Tax=Micromonospora sp. NBC_01796 TaxID=2975987 RepID=UPI002DDB68C2|nr:alpha/beta hydrolase [Micromonospora sp. NBC_01796]WSA86595.1 alpha/beta hydrolase [Micromonospora sp. NBC_01796]
MPEVTLPDGSTIEVEVHGTGPTVLLPVDPRPTEGAAADEMRRWGMDPALGRTLVDGLADAFRVVAFDYEGHLRAFPKPDTLTPDTIVEDLLTVADSVGAQRFAYYGYSWLALSGLQLAIRTDRLSALVMGGFPPIDGPYAEMLAVTTATHAMSPPAPTTPVADPPQAPTGADAWTDPADFDWSSVQVTLPEPQTRQFMTLYLALRGFDDRAAQDRITCPRLCFVGSADTIPYDERWGGVTVDIAGPVEKGRGELAALGWQVRVLDGLDHTRAMQPGNVLPVLRPWLVESLSR